MVTSLLGNICANHINLDTAQGYQAQASLKKISETTDTIYPGHDRPFRIYGENFEYLTEAPTIKISGFLDSSRALVSMELSLPPRFEPRINPDAI